MNAPPDAHAAVLDRDDAISAIAGHIADCDAFVISIPPALAAAASRCLAAVAGCIWYADNGTGIVLRLAGPGGIGAAAITEALLPGTTAAVAIVPKTTPAADLAAALGNLTDIPADGSQDLVMLHEGPRRP